jgi:hypothetical protein
MRRLGLAAFVLSLFLAPATGADEPPVDADPGIPAEVADRGDRVGVGTPVRVLANETVRGDAVGIGTRVEIDGTVRGSVVGVGSRVFVRGEILGDLVGVGSNLELAPGARIRGEVVNVFGTLDNQGAEVSQVVDMSPGIRFPAFGHLPLGILGFFTIWWKLLVLALVFVVLLLHTALVPDRVRLLSDEVPVRPVVAFLAGLLAYAALLVVNFFLAVTIVGIPLAVLVYFAFKILEWLGLAGIFHFVGRRIGALFGRDLSLLGAVMIGFLPFALLRFLPFCTGWILWFLLEIVAIGFVLLTRAGTRGSPVEAPAPVPAVPVQPAST